MRFPGASADAALLSTIIFPLFAAATGNIDCSKVVVDDARFDLRELGGARSVVHSVDQGPSFANTTYTVDICRPLGKAKHIEPKDQCPNGTRRRSSHHAAFHARSRAVLKGNSLCYPTLD